MRDLSLHILDIAENAVRAGAKNIFIALIEDGNKGELVLSIKDDGEGMPEEVLRQATDPFFTTKGSKKKIGLGLALLLAAAQQTGGNLKIESAEGKGTEVRVVFKSAHPDMKPIGNIAETITALVVGNPFVRFMYSENIEGKSYHFDTGKND